MTQQDDEARVDESKRRERGSGRIWQLNGGKIWWIQFYSRGRQVRESSGSENENDAKKLLKRRLSEVELGVQRPLRRVCYEDIRDAFMSDYVTNRRKSLYRDREGKPKLDKVENLNRFFAGYRVDEIDTDTLRNFAKKLQAEGKKNSTINRSLSVLRRMMNIAKREGRIIDVPFFPMLKEPAARQGFFEDAEYKQLLAALPVYARPVLAIAYFTGMRRREILNLKWDQIDFLRGTIRLNAGETKNGQGREIPIIPDLAATLREQRAKRVENFPCVCFRLSKKGHPIPVNDFRKVWYRQCVNLGFGRWEQATDPLTREPVFHKPSEPGAEKKPKMIYVGKTLHDCRRTAVRNLVRAGVPERIAMAVSGHQTRSVFDRYNIVSGRDLAEAGKKLGEYLAKNGANSGQISQSEENGAVERNVLPN